MLAIFSCGECEKKCNKEVKKEISLQLYSLRADIKEDYDATIKKAGEMGFTSVEAAGYNNGKFYGKTPAQYLQAPPLIGEHSEQILREHGYSDDEISAILQGET